MERYQETAPVEQEDSLMLAQDFCIKGRDLTKFRGWGFSLN